MLGFLSKVKKFIFRFTLCVITIHKKGDKIQAYKSHNVFVCERCGNLFTSRKSKYKK